MIEERDAVIQPFADQLEAVRGKIHVVNVINDFELRTKGLLNYWNCAERLLQSAKIIWDAKGPSDVAAMLIGMSMELLLKGIHVAFDKDFQKIHDLHKLCRTVGISVSEDESIILRALTESIYWASRYPAPSDWQRLFEATELFDQQRRQSGNLANRDIKERAISRENCERLWDLFADHYHRAREVRFESAEGREHH
jgi:HEPN domain-containing protein